MNWPSFHRVARTDEPCDSTVRLYNPGGTAAPFTVTSRSNKKGRDGITLADEETIVSNINATSTTVRSFMPPPSPGLAGPATATIPLVIPRPDAGPHPWTRSRSGSCHDLRLTKDNG